MATYYYECNGRICEFTGTQAQMKVHICNLFGTYFWGKRTINGRTWFMFGHAEVYVK